MFVGAFVFGNIILNNAIGEIVNPGGGVELEFIKGGPYENVVQGWDVDLINKNALVWLQVDRLDDDGNTLGSVAVAGGADITEDADENWEVNYWALALSTLVDAEQGRGNAWVRLPGRPQVNHARGPGDAALGGNDPDWMMAWDQHTIDFDDAGNGSASTSAALGIQGVRVNVRINASGI